MRLRCTSTRLSSRRLDTALFSLLDVPREGDFYICGPPGFLEDMRSGLVGWGVAAERVRSEVFGSGPALTPGIVGQSQRAPHPPAGALGTGSLVSFARSNLGVRWDAASRSLLEFAEACDVPVRWACRTGVCHSCETGLASGTVRYDPSRLSLQRPAIFLYAARNLKAMSFSISELDFSRHLAISSALLTGSISLEECALGARAYAIRSVTDGRPTVPRSSPRNHDGLGDTRARTRAP